MSNSCGVNGEIIKTYVIDTIPDVFSACTIITTDELNSCSLTGITLTDSILPTPDSSIDLGSPIRRFRDINTVSGTTTVWTATERVITPQINLGLDLSGNTRIITADNSIIQDDILLGGDY